MKKTRVNYFPPELREMVETDVYLSQVQFSMVGKEKYMLAQGQTSGAYALAALRSRIVEVREAYKKEMEAAALGIPIVYSATGVRHIGVRRFLRVAIYIDIEEASTPSKLWRFCGLGIYGKTVDTLATVRAPGKIAYNDRVRRLLAMVRVALLYRDSPYRPYYDRYNRMTAAKGIDKYRTGRRGGRYVTKLWLKHLWLVWRRQEGLPIPGGHEDDETQLAAPFGWR